MLKTINLSAISDLTPCNIAFSRSNKVAKFIYHGTDPATNNALCELLKGVQISKPEDSFLFKTLQKDNRYFSSGIP